MNEHVGKEREGEKNDFCRDDMKDMEGGSPEHKPGYGLILERFSNIYNVDSTFVNSLWFDPITALQLSDMISFLGLPPYALWL